MTTTKHTEGKLRVEHNGFFLVIGDDSDDPEIVAMTYEPQNEANAHRLALCWNSHDALVEVIEDYIKVADRAPDRECGAAVLQRARELISQTKAQETP